MFESYIDKVQVVRLMEDYVPKDEKNEKAVGGKFFIPKYQRGYRWTSLQVEQLLDDINEFKAEDEDEFYCLQPLVVTAEKNEDRWVVVDGQQRLTTIFIIIKCLRSIADSQKKKPIYSIDYESKPELKECLSKLKHDPDEEDGIELDKSDIDKYHITNAYNTVAKWVKSKVSGAEEGDFASDLMTKIRNSVCFIWYEADNGQDPETTFTQINMGKIPLTNAELIKALLLKKDNFDRNEEFRGDQARISMDWDIKENNLHKRDFWLFLTNDKAEERDVRIEMVFDGLASLQYESWAKASKARDLAKTTIIEIEDAITAATKAKEYAAKNEASLKAKLEEQKSNLKKMQTEEGKLKEKFEKLLVSNKFSNEQEFLGFVVDEETISDSQEEIKKYHEEVKSTTDQLKTAKEDAKGKKLVDITELNEQVVSKDAEVKEIRNRQNVIKNRRDKNEEVATNISNQKSGYEKAKAAHAVLTRLYKLVKGDTGTGKITLEQYIQAAGFDGIIVAANRRLIPMSEGQYELYRQEDSLGKRSNTFLDLEVLDNFTGHRRPVGNLSGGESFKASLSLALGLSDTVSSNIGGVQMDALFIDEGFGTLDKRSNDTVMETLLNLSGFNKLVGIISHREEFIENIPQQIKVSKGKEGSKVTIETGI